MRGARNRRCLSVNRQVEDLSWPLSTADRPSGIEFSGFKPEPLAADEEDGRGVMHYRALAGPAALGRRSGVTSWTGGGADVPAEPDPPACMGHAGGGRRARRTTKGRPEDDDDGTAGCPAGSWLETTPSVVMAELTPTENHFMLLVRRGEREDTMSAVEI